MRRPRIWLCCLFLASVAACSGRNAAPDASGIAGASGGGGAAGTGGGQAGSAAGGRGGSSGGGGSTGAGGQAGTSTGGGAGGQAGSSAGGGGGTTGAAGQAGGGGSAGAGGAAGASAGTGGRGGSASGLGGQAGGSAGTGGRGGRGGGGDACAMIVGITFLSVTEQECGRGGLRCRWRVSFTATMFDWIYSDVAESGSYTCSGTMVTGQRFGGTNTIEGQYDPASQILTWNGLPYTPQ